MSIGVLLALFIIWQFWWTDVVAQANDKQSSQALESQWQNQPSKKPGQNPIGQNPPDEKAGAYGKPFARLYVPKFWKDNRTIVEGDEKYLIDIGIGRHAKSALPGQIGNMVLAGHRTTYGAPFGDIAELKPGDPIVVETAGNWYVYKMLSREIVESNGSKILDPNPLELGKKPTKRLLTLFSCHPKFSDRQRFVVYSELAYWQPKSVGKPAELN